MTTGLGDMPRIAPNPSIWILAKGNLCAKVVILVLLGTLLLAGSAHAAASAAGSTSEASPPASSAESAPEAPPAAELTSEASRICRRIDLGSLVRYRICRRSDLGSLASGIVRRIRARSPTRRRVDLGSLAARSLASGIVCRIRARSPASSSGRGPRTGILASSTSRRPRARSLDPCEPRKEAKEEPAVELAKEATEVSASAASQSAATADNSIGLSCGGSLERCGRARHNDLPGCS